MLKREWGAESNGKLPHIFIHSKTAIYFPEFATIVNLPLGRIAALVPEFAVKDLPLGRSLMMMVMMNNTNPRIETMCYFPGLFIIFSLSVHF